MIPPHEVWGNLHICYPNFNCSFKDRGEKEEGKWGVVGIEEETDVTRFDDPELLQMIKYFQRRDKKR